MSLGKGAGRLRTHACALRALCVLRGQVAQVHLKFCYRVLGGDEKGFRPFRAQVLMGVILLLLQGHC